ncbi:hypothetical protein FP2506_14504 [Fulvimarina pelagi HTCC2506]|uniref:CapK protein n=1 Tax=Fulvimarina pelagi HTCC2506 TaxID=314231 RepID=Q0G429_9HYPH|nr:phenylacetate--CoA ligase family protein [Fulvimarina pelagi]EAU41652.1 hypothetical protein FP2506_14504 [Fulvimarina pelagi HTCC2506]
MSRDETARDLKVLERYTDQAFATQEAKRMIALQRQILSEQRLPRAEIAARVRAQALGLLSVATQTTPFYQDEKYSELPARISANFDHWAELPIIDRNMLQASADRFHAHALPQGHVVTASARSSGSTGTPVEVATTNVVGRWQQAFTLRSAVWTRRDLDATIAIIRKFKDPSTRPPVGAWSDHWSSTTAFPFRTGPVARLDAPSATVREHLDWLKRVKPAYLLTYPSLLRELLYLLEGDADDWRPRGISTLGEAVDEDLRKSAKRLCGLRVDDVYSAEECGVIAMQCPSHGRYHIQSESLMVEVLDDEGTPCKPGEEGRVVVTTLANFASPLIRYAVGDRAVAGVSCGCGRNLPVLTSVLGRERNLMVTSGGKFWPSFGTRRFAEIAPIETQQFRQTALDEITFRYVCGAALSGEQKEALRARVQASLPHPMNIVLERVPELTKSPSGKFEVFAREF